MHTPKLLRSVALLALTLVALGALGYALGGGSADTNSTPSAAVDSSATDPADDVLASINQALGLPNESAVTKPAASSGQAGGIAIAPSIAPDAKGALTQRDAASTSSAAAAPAPNAPPTAPDALSSLDDRKIVQTATLKLQVKDVSGSFGDVGRIATAAGGFVAGSNLALQQVGDTEQQVAAVTLRVPADRYQDVLGQLRALGAKVDAETSNASDITDQYSDLAASLRNLQATQDQLLTLLGQTKTISEVLQVQDRLNSVRGQIDQTQGRLNLYDKLSDLATISVGLRPLVAVPSAHTGGSDLGDTVSQAWQDSLDFLAAIAAGILRVVIFVWWLPLVGVPAYLIAARYLRSRPTPTSAVD